MNNRPGFCTECGAPIDPDDESRECAGCTDDIIDNDEPPDEDYPEFDWRNSAYVKTPSCGPDSLPEPAAPGTQARPASSSSAAADNFRPLIIIRLTARQAAVCLRSEPRNSR